MPLALTLSEAKSPIIVYLKEDKLSGTLEEDLITFGVSKINKNEKSSQIYMEGKSWGFVRYNIANTDLRRMADFRKENDGYLVLSLDCLGNPVTASPTEAYPEFLEMGGEYSPNSVLLLKLMEIRSSKRVKVGFNGSKKYFEVLRYNLLSPEYKDVVDNRRLT